MHSLEKEHMILLNLLFVYFIVHAYRKNKNKKSAPAQFSLLTLRLFREAVAKEQRDFIFY